MYYRLLEGFTTTPDGDGAKTYGVEVFDSAKPDATLHAEDCIADSFCIYQNDDITFCRKEMCRHIKLWNEFQPSLSQLKELIEDIICGEAFPLPFE